MTEKLERHIFLIDKPKGITSFDVIRRLRKKLGIRKMGHAGTLDPLASGLMIIGVEEGTKKLDAYLKLPKEYEVKILLGVRTDTGDLEGKIVEERSVSEISEGEVRSAVEGVKGKISLPVPAYSAIKSKGQPLYKAARRGERVEPPVKEMEVHDAKFLNLHAERGRAVVTCRFDVSSGTYIRSLAEEIGRRLGYPATVKELRRTRIGQFLIEDAEKVG